jgi:tetratricopeptide (TPR) repeat protein
MNRAEAVAPARRAGERCYRALFVAGVWIYGALFAGGIGYAVVKKGSVPELDAHALTDALERLQKGDVARAAREYDIAARLNPTDEGLARRGAELRGSLGDQDWEVALYAGQRDAQAHNPAVHRNLAQALHSRRRYEEAAAAYGKAIELAPGDPRAYAGIGEVMLDQDRFADAEKAFLEALRRDPANAAVHNSLGIAAALSGRHAEAVKRFERAVALNPGYRSNLDRARADLAAAEAGR